MWIFLDFSMAFSIWLIFFISVGQLWKLMWHMFVNLMWNAHMVLDEHEIWYAGCRHIVGHPCFGPIHFFIVFIDLWIFEVNACVDVVIWLIYLCLFFLIFIDIVPFVQLSWKLTCCTLNMSCLGVNYLRIFGIVLIWIWLKSFCLDVWCYVWPSLTCFGHEMNMMSDMSMGSIALAFELHLVDFGWELLAV
jgi:hypothetical protein